MQIQFTGLPIGFVLLVSVRYFSRLLDYNQDKKEEVHLLINETAVEFDIPIVFDKIYDYAFVRLICGGMQVFADLYENRVVEQLEVNLQNHHSASRGVALLGLHDSFPTSSDILCLRNPRVFSRKEKCGYSLCTEQGRGFLLKNRLAKAWEKCYWKPVSANDDMVDWEAVRVLSTYGIVNHYSIVKDLIC